MLLTGLIKKLDRAEDDVNNLQNSIINNAEDEPEMEKKREELR